jgi:hypothetical protein
MIVGAPGFLAEGFDDSAELPRALGGHDLLELGVGREDSSRSFSCAAASPVVGRRSAKLRRSPFTEYWGAGEGDVPGSPGAALPDGEANELQAVEDSFGEVQFRVVQSSERVVPVERF